jgi:transcription-repair coupling factor (superfamily II helicase)
MSDLAARLAEKGFERLGTVESPGQFAVRGGILDIFSFADSQPVRVEFSGDTIESIRLFDPETQASSVTMREYRTFLVGLRELSRGDNTFISHYLPPDSWIAFFEKAEALEHARRVLAHEDDPVARQTAHVARDAVSPRYGEDSERPIGRDAILPHWTGDMPPGDNGRDGISPHIESRIVSFLNSLRAFPTLSLSVLPVACSDSLPEDRRSLNFRAAPAPRLSGNLGVLKTELEALTAGGAGVFVVCENTAVVERFVELLEEGAQDTGHRTRDMGQGTRDKGQGTGDERREARDSGRELMMSCPVSRVSTSVSPVIGRLAQGFSLPDARVTVLTHSEVFNRYHFRRRPKDLRGKRVTDDFLTFRKGDLVVHQEHGVGRYAGMQRLRREGACFQEFLVLEYQGHEKLFVPANQADFVQRYVGSGGDSEPPLARLGSQAWQYKKERVGAALEKFARELLEIQVSRECETRTAYSKDSNWQREFEASFSFEDTEDQMAVTVEIKKDMESPRPMDRLVCGDVGYGKTELAMRTAFKAATHGRQTAVLVPTTVLAQQHYINFRDRMAQFPITIDVLSRFRSKDEQAEVLRHLRAGAIDIVIGTHRLIQKDVAFRDLGLVIVDEEQRFGVEHKEILKRLRATVDVLVLTATPIPRTLHMSLLGLRDISTLSTPPQDRRSVATEVCCFEPARIRQAILRELDRGGQVFFLHNRVFDIDSVARRLTAIVPEARFAVAHGQMPEHVLERTMLDFIETRHDVLVTTTIIESGLDIPNANTIFVHDADMFGLADLHQLRGRVGRYKNQAYAYFLLPENRPPTPDAAKRLRAIQEFDELGAGFRIAMRDLEIRGAGNLLGREQSGHIAAVGYEMYCRLLDGAVRRARNEEPRERVETCVDLRLDAYLPETYIIDEEERIEAYRAISCITNEKDAGLVEAKLADRYGALGTAASPARNLFEIAILKAMAQRKGILLAAEGEETVKLNFKTSAAARAFADAHRNRVRVVEPTVLLVPIFRFRRGGQRDVVKLLREILA